ncbi:MULTISPECIES: DUF5403 family protein [Nocardiopsidaceae]|uniref:DUF5403 family protein n=1 Tax=Marinactinospora rubrisoli TaxID=2715399 RepID=A0ABW2KLF1_9ACTN|nr:DUF5403 family protein [Marinitenerispora sediminis]
MVERAEILATRARTRLAQHRESGRARIEVIRGRRSDAFVELVDDGPDGNAVAIEYGRTGSRGRGASQGVYALHYAIGMAPDG